MLTPFVKKRDDLPLVDHRLADFCDKVASIDQLDSGFNNEIGLVVNIVYLRHVMHHEVDKLLLNADDVFHVRALAIGHNTDQLVSPGHTERTEKCHEHFDLQVGYMTTKVWHRDQMKVIEDPFYRNADADIEECDAAMGAAIKHNKKCPHVVAQKQGADLGQSDTDEHADILADQMVTTPLNFSMLITSRVCPITAAICRNDMPHDACLMMSWNHLTFLITMTYDPSLASSSGLNSNNALRFSLIRRIAPSAIFGSEPCHRRARGQPSHLRAITRAYQ
ncbi:unnamed protein product [Sphagnum jensenii]|uniref:Uncharacterized protein n=1 Tax=Sphagnum jensenii TaxID=128206 RepID=A0ABP0XEC9_9BRYO